MSRELYFDISSEESGGSLYRVKGLSGVHFFYSHSTYNSKTDEVQVFETIYPDFAAYWKELTKKDAKWYYLHPLFVHPEQRDFVREQLKTVNWGVHTNKKWQESHQRQWKKVLTDPGSYYMGPAGKD